jgi:hypothetical protein
MGELALTNEQMQAIMHRTPEGMELMTRMMHDAEKRMKSGQGMALSGQGAAMVYHAIATDHLEAAKVPSYNEDAMKGILRGLLEKNPGLRDTPEGQARLFSMLMAEAGKLEAGTVEGEEHAAHVHRADRAQHDAKDTEAAGSKKRRRSRENSVAEPKAVDLTKEETPAEDSEAQAVEGTTEAKEEEGESKEDKGVFATMAAKVARAAEAAGVTKGGKVTVTERMDEFVAAAVAVGVERERAMAMALQVDTESWTEHEARAAGLSIGRAMNAGRSAEEAVAEGMAAGLAARAEEDALIVAAKARVVAAKDKEATTEMGQAKADAEASPPLVDLPLTRAQEPAVVAAQDASGDAKVTVAEMWSTAKAASEKSKANVATLPAVPTSMRGEMVEETTATLLGIIRGTEAATLNALATEPSTANVNKDKAAASAAKSLKAVR